MTKRFWISEALGMSEDQICDLDARLILLLVKSTNTKETLKEILNDYYDENEKIYMVFRLGYWTGVNACLEDPNIIAIFASVINIITKYGGYESLFDLFRDELKKYLQNRKTKSNSNYHL